jgi:glycosyltransferase involved in cell wall biosynthesis
MIVLSAYALSGRYRSELEGRLGGGATFLTLSALRRLPPRKLLAALRQGRGKRCVLALEDPSSYSVLPILEGVSALVGAARIDVATPELAFEPVSRKRALAAPVPVTFASAQAQVAQRRARRELARLESAPRIDARLRRLESLLFVNPNLWFGLKAGGSVGHIAGVVNALVARGVDVTLASPSEPILVSPAAHAIALAPPSPTSLPVETNYYRFQHDVVRALTAAGSHDLVYQRHAIGSYAGAVVSRRRLVPLVLEYNGSEVWAAEHWGSGLRYGSLALAAERVSLRHAHLVVTVSNVLADELRERGIPDERIVAHPNGVDPELFDASRQRDAAAAARERHAIPPDALVVGFVGTFGMWHGAEVLAEAVARLHVADRDWLERNRVIFLFVGDGLRQPEVRRITEPAADVVRFTGLVPQPEAPGYLAACDVLVSPHVPNPDGSPFFGSPTKLFEYMATARAIVASDLAQIGEILDGSLRADRLPDGPPGDDAEAPAVLAMPGSVDELATGIRFVCESGTWRAALGANARRRVVERYTWGHHVDAILERARSVLRA